LEIGLLLCDSRKFAVGEMTCPASWFICKLSSKHAHMCMNDFWQLLVIMLNLKNTVISTVYNAVIKWSCKGVSMGDSD